MNKKFSTLLASVLLTSAFSTAAYADPLPAGVNKDLKGKTVALFTEEDGDNVVSLTGTGALSKVEKGDAFLADYADGAFKTANSALWTIADVKFDQTTGVGVYQFVNKQTGAYLAINLETDNNGSSSAAAKLNGAGNRNWSVTTTGVLYAYAKDSIYTLDPTTLALKAKKGTVDDIPAGDLKIFASVPADADADLTLTAEAFNAMLAQSASNGKLHFNNSKDVTDGQTNLLTANKYVAYKENTDPTKGFFLAEKDNETEINKNPYLLMVDTLFYNASAAQFNKLKLDTLSVDKDNAAKIKAGTYKVGDYAPSYDKYARPINASIFNATYYYAKDSIALNVAGKPQKLDGAAVITDGKITVAAVGDMPNNGHANVDATLKTAATAWLAGDVNTRLATDMTTKVNTFAQTAFKVTTAATAAGANEGDEGAIKVGNDWYTLTDVIVTPVLAENGDVASEEVDATDYTKVELLTGSALVAAAQAIADKLENAEAKTKVTAFNNSAKGLIAFAADANKDHYFVKGAPYREATEGKESVVLTELAGTRVLTVKTGTTDVQLAGYILPLIQPFASAPAGDAEITSDTKLFFIQEKNVGHDAALRATTQTDKYLVGVQGGATELAEEVSNENPYAQWAFIPSAVGSYSIVNRATGYALYSGMVSKVKDADGNVVADTYVAGADTLKLAAVDLSGADIYTEDGTKYDYTGYFYAGPQNGKVMSFEISPVSPFMSTLALQVKADSTLVLGDAVEAPVWYFEEKAGETYGLTISGMPELKSVAYKVYMKDAEGVKYFVVADGTNFVITKEDSKAGANAKALSFRTIAKDTYLISDGAAKMTINPTPEKPIIEATAVANNLKNDYFTVGKASVNIYRTLTAEDGVNGNAAIFMNNEDSRYLYENSANIVANNGNKVAKDSLNFLGIFNAFELDKNPTLYVDTAYVEREGNIMPQYMFAVGVEEVEATAAIPCTEAGVHVDKDGKATTADKCVHATPATKGYKAGRYLVSVADSAALYAKHPANYDNTTRFAFVPAKHYFGEDSLVIDNSKFSGTKNAKNDTLKIADNALNAATFALLIKDQADKSFYLQTKGGYVRILNGVPVITANIEDAAIFNIEASELEATANEAIEAAGVQVVAGKGTVTVQGAAGKVITVANVLGQTIANQVAASDNVTIAAPAGIVVVAVEGEATKVVVK